MAATRVVGTFVDRRTKTGHALPRSYDAHAARQRGRTSRLPRGSRLYAAFVSRGGRGCAKSDGVAAPPFRNGRVLLFDKVSRRSAARGMWRICAAWRECQCACGEARARFCAKMMARRYGCPDILCASALCLFTIFRCATCRHATFLPPICRARHAATFCRRVSPGFAVSHVFDCLPPSRQDCYAAARGYTPVFTFSLLMLHAAMPLRFLHFVITPYMLRHDDHDIKMFSLYDATPDYACFAAAAIYAMLSLSLRQMPF